MKKQDPLAPFLPQKPKGIDGFENDIDGEIDDIWHEAVQKYVAEVLWNPNHPDRKTQATKGGKGSGNWGHGGLPGVHGGSSPAKVKKMAFEPSSKKLDMEKLAGFAGGAPGYISPTPKLTAQGNVSLFDLDKYYDEDAVNKINNRLLQEHIKGKIEGDLTPEEFANYRQSIDWIADTAGGLEGYDPETGFYVDGEYKFDFQPSEYGDGNANIEMGFYGHMFEKNGTEIGEVQITAELGDDTNDEAYVHWFRFYGTDAQGTGFGKRYMASAENTLFAMGARTIGLQAGLTVGGYFWARAGYSFAHGERELRGFLSQLENEWKYEYGESIPEVIIDNIEHSWDIAMLRGPDGGKIGKKVLLGSDWHGIKMNPDWGGDDEYLEGYDIGQEYYGG